MGEAARASIRSLEAAGIPVALNNVASRAAQAGRVLRATRSATTTRIRSTSCTSTPTTWAGSPPARGKRYFTSRYTIGYWFWELSTFREEWVPFFGYVDEVWVASDFVRDALAAWSPRARSSGCRCRSCCRRSPARPRALRLPRHAAVFLYIFDVSSQTERKNPAGAIGAFRRAGFQRDEAVLVLKFTNAEYDRDAVRRLHGPRRGPQRRDARRLHGPRRAVGARSPRPIATSRRIAPRASA